MSTESETGWSDDDLTVMIPLGCREAINLAEFLEAYGEESDMNIAANIRYLVNQAREAESK